MWKRSKNEVTVTVEEPAAVTNFVKEVLHQADKAAADGTDWTGWTADHLALLEAAPCEMTEEVFLASVQQYRYDRSMPTDLPLVTVEMWVAEDPSKFVYTELVPAEPWMGDPNGSEWPWWMYNPRPSPALDLDQHLEYRELLAGDEFRWVPWQHLDWSLRWHIQNHVLPPDWFTRLLADENDAYVLDRVMVYVKGDL